MRVTPFETTEKYLRELVGRTPEGGRVITVRECIRQCQVSKAVVDRVATLLHGEKLLEIRPRSGLYKPVRTGSDRRVINVLHFGDSHIATFHSELIYALNVVMSERSWSPQVSMMHSERKPEQVVESLIAEKSPLAVTFCAAHGDMKYLDRLREAGIRLINMLPNTAEPLPSSLYLDDALIVRTQLEYLMGLGHRKIAYLHATREDYYSRPINKRLDAFCRLALEKQLKVDPRWICYIGWETGSIERNLGRMLEEAPTPTAVIINDEQVQSVYSTLQRRGIAPGRDIGVVGCDDLVWAGQVDPGLTTVRVSRIEAIRKLCEQIEADEFRGVEYLPVELVERNSVPRIAAQA